MLIMIEILIAERIGNARIIWVVGGLRYEYHMSIFARASFELGGCSYHYLDDHRKKGRNSY